MTTPLRPYMTLLARTNQLQRAPVDDEAVLTRGFCVFIGILIGLAMAWSLLVLAGMA